MALEWSEVTNRKEQLIDFIMLLDNNKLINKKIIIANNESGFKNRLKLQKLVFLAKKFDLDLGYPYSLHIHGPYSKELAIDYYIICKANLQGNILKQSMTSFINKFKDKDEKYLEILATAVDVHDSIKDRNIDEIVAITSKIKTQYDPKEIREIIYKERELMRT